MSQKIYSPREAAIALNLSLTHIFHRLWTNHFPGAEKRDGRWVIPASAIELYKKEQKLREGR